MTIKSLLPIVIGVLVATVAYNMFLKKIIEKDGYELEDYDTE
jgi:hypothetical protein